MLHCPLYSSERITLLDKIRDIKEDIVKKKDGPLVRTLILFDIKISKFNNAKILSSTIE